ncbi:MAG: hypothetical protein AVDCRST_MAG38-2578, partial [uncultured Solirubrobacteraceae bacterium]
ATHALSRHGGPDHRLADLRGRGRGRPVDRAGRGDRRGRPVRGLRPARQAARGSRRAPRRSL